MARTSTSSARLILLPLALTLLILSPTTLAQQSELQSGMPFVPSGQSSDQPRRLQRGQQAQNRCQFHRLTATEPTKRNPSEAGVTETWDTNEQPEFKCVGVTVTRRSVEPKGLVLPHYTNAPSISYIIRGRGLYGMLSPGCPETYESGSPQESYSEGSRQSEHGSEGVRDQHQKVRRFREGDIIVSPAGTSKWVYNDGEETLTYVSLFDTSNYQNQLDDNLRNFFLAGNPQANGEQGGHHDRHQSRGSHDYESDRRHQYRGSSSEETEGKNIFSGFNDETLAEVFEMDRETINKLQGQDDNRGAIVHVEKDLELLIPEYSQEEQRSERSRHHSGEHGPHHNGIEQTICSAQVSDNIDNPEKADVFNPQGGRLTSLNSRKLPILSQLRLSAEKVHLYQNAIFAPNWKINAHSIVYFTKGSGRVQIVSNDGLLVLDDTVQEGQLLVIPQNFVVLKKAGQEGLEWIAFLTNDEAMNSPLAGRISAIRGMPEEVVMNSFGLSREEAKRLKYGRQELSVFSPSQKSSQRRGAGYAIV